MANTFRKFITASEVLFENQNSQDNSSPTVLSHSTPLSLSDYVNIIESKVSNESATASINQDLTINYKKRDLASIENQQIQEHNFMQEKKSKKRRLNGKWGFDMKKKARYYRFVIIMTCFKLTTHEIFSILSEHHKSFDHFFGTCFQIPFFS